MRKKDTKNLTIQVKQNYSFLLKSKILQNAEFSFENVDKRNISNLQTKLQNASKQFWCLQYSLHLLLRGIGSSSQQS